MIYCDKEFIGKKFKEYRKKMKLTQEELSSKINIDEKHYGKLERGIFFPSLENFFKIIEELNIPLFEFNIQSSKSTNKFRDELIKEICMLDNSEIKTYLNIFKSIKLLKK